jgi:nitroreductase
VGKRAHGAHSGTGRWNGQRPGVSLFFRYALSLTAWKRAGESTWALRANPSSGNLHPTEGYALLPALGDLSDGPGVYHVRALAARVSCGQAIAGDGAFSLGMIADYMGSLVSRGAAFYRNLFWEAGLVGQVLYLEAEEAGIRATGIGCYFDDPVHEVFGITSRDWQSLYHFTVGGPVEDLRLMTLPAYSLEEAR